MKKLAYVIYRHQQPTGIRTWVDSPLGVASQLSNQLGQRVRPTSQRLAGQLDCHTYRQVSNIRCTLVGNKIVDNSDVVGASPVGAAPTTSSLST